MLAVPIYSQRDPRWSTQRLGTNDSTNIGGWGCAMTSVTMVDGAFDPSNAWTPAQVDDAFTTGGGYVDGGGRRSPDAGCCLLDWSRVQSILPNTHWAGVDNCQLTDAPVAKIKDHLNNGGLAVLQVGFGGDPGRMHFVTAVDFSGDDIIFNDPWYGDRSSFASKRYGTGLSVRDILAVHYFTDTTPPVKPVEAPPAPVVVAQPEIAKLSAPVPAGESQAAPSTNETLKTAPAASQLFVSAPQEISDKDTEQDKRLSALELVINLIKSYLMHYKNFVKFINRSK